MAEIIVNEQEVKNLTEYALPLLDQAKGFIVDTKETCEAAGSIVVEAKKRIKSIEAFFKPLKDQAHTLHKSICGKETEAAGTYKEVEKIMSGKVSVFLTEQRRLQQEAERKAQREADEKAKMERKFLEQQALEALERDNKVAADILLGAAEEVKPVAVEVAPVIEKTMRLESGGSITGKSEIDVTLPQTEHEIQAACMAIATGSLPVSCVSFSLSQVKAWAKLNNITGTRFGITITEKVALSFKI
jgi:hypothetical protein